MSGIATLYDGHLQMVHPDRVVDAAGLRMLPPIDPVYPLTEGLASRTSVNKAIEHALDRFPALPEWQDAGWIARNRLSAFRRRAAQHSPPGKRPTISTARRRVVAARLR